MKTTEFDAVRTSPVRSSTRLTAALIAALFASTILPGVTLQAQTSNYWLSVSPNGDSFTNFAFWSLGTVPTSSEQAIMTNGGICLYTNVDITGTNIIDQLYLGPNTGGVSGGTNTFNMTNGMLTMMDSGGFDFAVGGYSTTSPSNNAVFNLAGGTLNVTNSNADAWVGLGTNSVAVVNFTGGTANFNNLFVGGKGKGTININGGTVNIISPSANFELGAGLSSAAVGVGAGTLNLISGTLNETNSNGRNIYMGEYGGANFINVSGGTMNVGGIGWGAGSSSANVVNTMTVSGGFINSAAGGFGRNGALDKNNLVASGGTFSTLPGQSWTLSGLILVTLNTSPGPGIVTFAPLAGTVITLSTNFSGTGTLNIAGPGPVIFGGDSPMEAVKYTGNIMVSGGMLSLAFTGGSSIANDPNIIVAGGAIFDVSELSSPLALVSGQTLSNSTSTAIINGSLNPGSGTVSLLYAPGTPAFTITTNNSENVNANQATLTLSASTTFKINNTGSALGAGNYLIISTNNGSSIAGTPPGTVAVTGGGIQAGNIATLSTAIDGQLYLVVAALPPAPAIGAQSPITYTNLFTLYAGANPTFSISASSAVPVSYQWFSNGVGIPSATNASLTLTNVQPGSLTTYCVASNYAASSTSLVWSASVIPAPASYPSNVLSLNPIGYWRLNDTNLDGPDNGDGDNGYICHDYAGGNDGTYTNVYLGQPGYNPISDPSDNSAFFGDDADDESGDVGDQDANSIYGINFGSPTNTSAAFTVEAWVSGYPQTYAGAGIVALGYGNGGEQYCMDCGAPNDAFRFFIRDASGATHLVNSSVKPSVNSGQGPWYHLVGVVDEINSHTVTFYINGVPVGTAAVSAGSGVLSSSYAMDIGARPASATTNLNLQFQGYINDVAVFNYALSQNQVLGEYLSSGNIAPFLVQVPSATYDIFGLTNLVIPATASGSAPVGYYWYDVNGGTNVASGTTNGVLLNATLTVSNIPPAWANDTLELTVTNAYGSTNVFVVLTNFAPITVDAWTNITAPDYFTNTLDWTMGTPSNQDEVALTNGGTIYYIAGSPNNQSPYLWTNAIDQLWMGEGANGVGGSINSNGDGTNLFLMSGGSLTMLDASGIDFAIGGNVTPGSASIPSTNVFTMTGGTLNVTNSTAANWIALASNSISTVNFDGGTANLNTLYISGAGSGTVNINGGTVNIVGSSASPVEIGAGTLTNRTTSTLNMISGVLSVTNNPGRSIALAVSDSQNTMNVSGGTVYASGLSFGNVGSDINPGTITNTFNLSGGMVYLGNGTVGRDGSLSANSAWFSGGTISTLPGQNSSWSGLVPIFLTNSPGPGIVTFAPSAGTIFTFTIAFSGPGGLNVAGPGQTILSGGTYTGNTIVSGGTLSLSSGASIAHSLNLIVAGGAIFDVSALSSPLALSAGQTLSNSTSTAVISGSINTGSGTASLAYASGTPSFMVVSNGTFTLSPSTAFNIYNTGPALALGSYLIISTNGTDNSMVAGTAPSVTVSGGGIAANAGPSLSISNNELYLVVGTVTINPNPTNLVCSVTNNLLYLSWPTDHTGWQLQAQTNKVSVGLGANWANYNPSTATNQVSIPINLTNGTVFYRLIYTP